MSKAEIHILIKSTLRIYRESITASFVGVKLNFRLLLIHILLIFATYLSLIVASILGQPVGGFLFGAVIAFLAGIYLASIAITVNKERGSFPEVWHNGILLFPHVIGVLFLLWILDLLSSLLFNNDDKKWLLMCINMLITVFFNVLPESIYFNRGGTQEKFIHSFEFIRENFLEWYSPWFIVLLSVLAFYGGSSYFWLGILTNPIDLLTQFVLLGNIREISILSLLKLPIFLLLFYFLFVFRGVLYRELSQSSRRKRIYQEKFK